MRRIRVALIQFDAVPEEASRNVPKMTGLVRDAVGAGAQWVLFHEGTVCDYTPRLEDFAEEVPSGASTVMMRRLAAELNCHIAFGLSERERDRFYIAHVFVGPQGLIYCYRKTWLWRQNDDYGYRNEWARYDCGDGPELFEFDGVQSTCFICADGEAPRCVQRAAQLQAQVVFYPNNRHRLPEFEDFGARAAKIGAPMLVTNRVGLSWVHDCEGGCVVYGANGAVLAKANREGREEILLHDLIL
jgi:predicted amidohydrolase